MRGGLWTLEHGWHLMLKDHGAAPPQAMLSRGVSTVAPGRSAEIYSHTFADATPLDLLDRGYRPAVEQAFPGTSPIVLFLSPDDPPARSYIWVCADDVSGWAGDGHA